METALLENCVKQYQILLTALKGYLTNIKKNKIDYDEIKRTLFTTIKITNTSEEIIKVYNNENK